MSNERFSVARGEVACAGDPGVASRLKCIPRFVGSGLVVCLCYAFVETRGAVLTGIGVVPDADSRFGSIAPEAEVPRLLSGTRGRIWIQRRWNPGLAQAPLGGRSGTLCLISACDTLYLCSCGPTSYIPSASVFSPLSWGTGSVSVRSLESVVR